MKYINFTFLLTILMSMVGTLSSAHDIEVVNADGKTIYYNYANNQTELSVTYRGSDYTYAYNSYSGIINIPESVTYNGTIYPVTSIGSSAFYKCSGLTSIKIPNSVTSIGSSAFDYCRGLTSIEIPNSVTSIGDDAFSGCSGLTSVTIPNSVTSIGSYAFSYCSGLTSIEIPNSVTSIGRGAFCGCSRLTSIEIPNSVTSIGDYAFSGCSRLTSIEIPNSVTSIGDDAFSFCSGLITITVAGDNPIYDSRDNCNAIIETTSNTLVCGCPSTIIPNSVTSIGDGAFSGCFGLTSIEIPNSVTSISSSAFSFCYDLTSVTIGNSVTSIGSYAFSSCSSLPSIFIPKATTMISDNVFNECTSLKEVVMEDRDDDTVLALGSDGGSNPLFYDCPLDSVYIGRNISYGNTSIYGYSPFYRNTSLRSVVITDRETEISENEFYGCTNLKNVSIGDGVTSIGNWAFSGCAALDNFSFGSSMKTIGKEAFSECTAMTKLVSRSVTPPVCKTNALDDINKRNCTLTIPQGTLAQYQAADQWKEFFFIEEKDLSSVNNITMDDGSKQQIVATYDLNGRRTTGLQRGMNIVKMKNGETKKVVVK